MPDRTAAAEPAPPPATAAPAAATEPVAFAPRGLGGDPPARPAADPLPSPPAPVAGDAAQAAYVVRPGDSWWAVAAAAYGDGRLYRALFAWNRRLDARVALAPGTRLEIPPRPRLEAAWPDLVPPPEPHGR